VVYDPGKRAAAARLSLDYPGWLIMWGPHSRLYFAYPAFDAPPGTILTAPSSGGLRARMRQAELTATAGPQHAATRPIPPRGTR
jgi:hypothetical protein